MELESQIKHLVSQLPEVYQPIYGFSQYDNLAARSCSDRLEIIQNIALKLRKELGRPLRVLDIGCAQGFFCFNLAAQGDEVFGIERQPDNFALCEGLAKALSLKATFINADCITGLETLPVQQFDLVIAFSIFHHLCFEKGLAATRQIIDDIGKKTTVFLIETARHDEPPKWSQAQPKDPYEFIRNFAYTEKVSEHNTHLSSLVRPIFFCSNTHWYAGGAMQRFESWTDSSHEFVGTVYEHTRRYFFTHDLILKSFRFAGAKMQLNRDELNNEIGFLSNIPPVTNILPKLINFKIEKNSGWLLREKLPGIRLSAAILHQQNYDARSIIENILQQLVNLEVCGLYQQDLRAWNIILSSDQQVKLIDYGTISRLPHDTLSPDKNIFLNFIIVAYEIINKKLLENRYFITSYLNLHQYPTSCHAWLLQIITTPPSLWSFKLFLELFKNPGALTPTAARVNQELQAWLIAFDAKVIQKKIKLRKVEQLVLKKIQEITDRAYGIKRSKSFGFRLTGIEASVGWIKRFLPH